MSVGTLSPQQLKSIVEDKWRTDERARAFGLHATERWRGPEAVDLDIGTASVVRADTVFRFREVLRTVERSNGRVILLTRLQQHDLGNDVVGRLARSRLFPIDYWASLCSLFKAKELDRSVCDPVLAQALLDHAPPDGYPPVSAGVLDAGTVWKAMGRHVFGMRDGEPDIVSLMRWAASKPGSQRYMEASDELRESLRRRMRGQLGEVAESIFRFLESGAATDSLALAVCCQVVFGLAAGDKLADAAARMERFHANQPIPEEIGRRLGFEASEAIAEMDGLDDPEIASDHLHRADELLKQLRCEEYAYRNQLTLGGYEQGLARLGSRIEAAVADPTPEAIGNCEQLLAEVAGHRIAKLGRKSEQVRRAEMAVRLVRWLANPGTWATSFAEQADLYRREIAFVDWARDSIRHSEDVLELSQAYQTLGAAVLARRESFNRGFAESLANWTKLGSTDSQALGVENVLGEVVAKVTEAGNRVLLIVLDGISWPVAHELLADIRQEHWFQATLDPSSELPPAVVAAIPSVTGFSRTSLLSGTLTWGDASVEKRNFESSPVLRPLCDKKYPPILFHKNDLTLDARGMLSESVITNIVNANNRVVGVVINAVDDRLSNAQQLRNDWTLDSITPLSTLLKLARDAGRVIILASDHGHVWHRSDAKLYPGDGGSRWRTASSDPIEGEILLTGKRARDQGGKDAVVVPAIETIYYGRQQNGYHGGATPQEMVCPLVLLTESRLDRENKAYPGLTACEYLKPDWWSPAPKASALPEVPSPATVVRQPPPDRLFDDRIEDEAEPSAPTEQIKASSGAAWVEMLLSSAAYQVQKNFVRRHPPEDSVVQRCLAALDAQGGIMTPAALSKAADIPPGRLDGQVAQIQRVLNVDGYEILTFSRVENKIELNVSRLKRQFDLE